MSLSEEPELLPLYRQRYGITDPISSESQVPSSKSGSKPKATPPPGSLSAKKKKKKRVHRSVSEGGSDLSIISDSGRFFPLIEERTSGNLRTSTIADLVHWSPGTRGHEMSDLQGDTVRRVMLSSTESSLSSGNDTWCVFGGGVEGGGGAIIIIIMSLLQIINLLPKFFQPPSW